MNPPCPDDVILEDLVTNIVFYIANLASMAVRWDFWEVSRTGFWNCSLHRVVSGEGIHTLLVTNVFVWDGRTFTEMMGTDPNVWMVVPHLSQASSSKTNLRFQMF